ncbi:hypothetical protein LAZ67_10001977 [Cordylochernes scorpioides]|uniref:Uncharacterized protein n=1 Tax=Cordylochernes scorpioides TaxID=51811 RepID=A0ABY6KWC0_9ARAC|nr:hypothetical protein LAZ67_10001977 [Cordylochernes scorpioides]
MFGFRDSLEAEKMYTKNLQLMPSTATNPENEDKVGDLIRHDRRITIRELLIEHLCYRKICSKWVPMKLTHDQRGQRDLYDTQKDTFSNIVTGDGTWEYLYDPETKAQSLEWYTSREIKTYPVLTMSQRETSRGPSRGDTLGWRSGGRKKETGGSTLKNENKVTAVHSEEALAKEGTGVSRERNPSGYLLLA